MAVAPAGTEPPPQPARLVGLDFLRGLALTIVLVDHIDDLLVNQEFFTRWTLKGLGFSDAAEAFVFLAGFTFGWVFSPRLDRDGFWTCQRRVLLRSVQIYAAMIATTFIVSALAWSVWRTSLAFHLPLTVTTSTMFLDEVRGTATLRNPVWGISILVVYVCVLPFLPAILVLAKRSLPAALALSLSVYAATQLSPALDFGDAGFNPLAWQVLAVSALAAGHWAATRCPKTSEKQKPGILESKVADQSEGPACKRRKKPGFLAACFVLALGVVVMLARAATPEAPYVDWVNRHLIGSPAFSKTNLGVARVLHFAAVAIVVAAILRRWPDFPEATWARPFVWSGRHSLPLFCLGVVLAYLAVMASVFLPTQQLSLLFLAADAVAVQFAAAWLLEARRLWRHADRQAR